MLRERCGGRGVAKLWERQERSERSAECGGSGGSGSLAGVDALLEGSLPVEALLSFTGACGEGVRGCGDVSETERLEGGSGGRSPRTADQERATYDYC